MNKVQQKIYDEVVAPAIGNLAGLRIGTIRRFHPLTKRAIIAIHDMQGNPEREIPNVPIVRQQGAHESGPFVGDTVLIGFFNNDLRYPVIIGTVDLRYNETRGASRDVHKRKGANLTDLYVKREGEIWDVSQIKA